MNIDEQAAADAIMSARHSDAFDREACVKILRDNSRDSSAHLIAAERMDWMQVVLNGGPPCFHICEDGYFCGRAERWEGHGDLHNFTSLADMVREVALTVQPAGAAQPKSESWPRKTAKPSRGWPEIARGAADQIAYRRDTTPASIILAAIERSHAALIVCRDHWKTSFEHERENVIRLREIVYKFHSDNCVCEDCNLVRKKKAFPGEEYKKVK